LGLEYRLADLRKDPLPSAIRLADNMDIMANRLSVIQREPAFLDIVRILGDGKPVSQLLSQLESLENLSPLPSSWQAELIQQSALFQNFQADLNPPEKFKSQHSENGTQTEELVPRIRFTHPIAKTLISTISRSNPLSALRKGDEIKPARKNEAFPQLVSKNASNRGDFLPLQTWEIKVAQQLSNELPQYPNPKIMKRALLGFIANHVLSQKKYEAFTQANAQAKKEISLASLELSSTAYPHFGGTQAITSVALKRSRGKKNPSPYIEVVLNQELYDQLNEVKVKELVFPAPLSSESSRQPPLTSQKSFSDKAPPTEISVEVGRYQIFRFEQALQSIRYSGKSIPIEVVLKSSKKRVRKQSSQKTS